VDHLIDTHLTASHLRLLVAIVEEHSLIGAAGRLSMTQPAVTKALQAAEHQLGVPLFTRTSSGMVPTIYGDALVARARVVLSQLKNAVQEINDLREGTGGRVAVGTLLAASPILLPRAIAQIHEKWRNIVVSVVEGTNDLLLPAVRRGDLDLVVGRLPDTTEHGDFLHEVLLVDMACVVVRPGHPLADSRELKLADLLEWNWVLPPQETTLRHQIDQSFRREDVNPPVPAVESVCLSVNRTLLMLTDYLSVWPWQVACRAAEANGVVILPIALPATEGPIGITARRDAPFSPAVDLFVSTLRAVAKGIPVSPHLHIPASNGSPK
jgi:DNA-binding transcriptional LysR family regulator